MKVPQVSVAMATGAFLYSNVASAANSTASIKSETSPIAKNLMAYYTTNLTTTGVLPSPYPWYEAATLFSTMINYAFYTGDSSFSDTVAQGLVSQVGDNNDFEPSSETSSETTFGQSLWALATMSAAETGFQNPSDSSKTGWVGFAQNAWQEQAVQWNNSLKSTCKGGLNTDISGSGGIDALSNGAFFALSARLARYTGNGTFGDAAESVYSWAESSGLINTNGSVSESLNSDCKNAGFAGQLSADAAVFILGAAHMYNSTDGATTWKTRLNTLLTAALKTFTPDGDGIVIEVSCERQIACTTPTLSYKSIFASALVDTLSLAPFTAATITPVIQSSANAAVKSCSSAPGVCGTQWTWGGYDHLTGAGQEMAALVIMQGLLVNGTTGNFKTGSTGGASSSATGTGSGSGSSGGASGTGTGTSSSPSASTSKKSGAERMILGYCSVLLGIVAMIFVGLL